jgi:DNA polymerase-3 subunit beta
MKFAIERAALLKSLAHVQSIVEVRTTIPILANVKLEAVAAQVAMAATDMDLVASDRADAEVETPGASTVPAKTFYDIVRKLPEGSRVSVALDPTQNNGGNEITVTAGRSTFTLPCLPAADFPELGEEALEHRFAMPVADLRKVVDKTRFAISTEETRYYLNGIFLHAVHQGGADVLRGVATDGHRLARVEIPLPKGAESIPAVIVPRKAVSEIRKLIDAEDADIEIGVGPGRIRFGVGSAVLLSRLIDGTFPDYERVIPTRNDKVLVVATKPFHEAVDRVATISTEKSRAVKLAVSANKLVVSAISPDAARAVEDLDAGYTAEAVEIGFNARYILDMTAQIEGDEVELDIADAASPTLVRDPGDPATLYVLMPMRV